MAVSLDQFRATFLTLGNQMTKIAEGIADLKASVGGLKEGEEQEVFDSLDSLEAKVKAIADVFAEPIPPPAQ